MPDNKQRLELTWIGKGQEPKLEPRILIEDKEKSYGDPNAPNMLIHGDNLLALKALEQDYAGKVKCIYIDPPYNTGSAFEHYDDGLEHSQWLNLMSPRLKLLKNLLADDGSIWISIDDNEAHYLKVLCDEVFGRKNFITTIAWQKKYGAKSDSKFLSESHEFIIVYGRNIDKIQINRLQRTALQDERYKNPDNDPRGPWTSGDLLRNEVRDYAIFPIISPKTGKSHLPPTGTSWRFNREKIVELISENRLWFGEKGNNVPRLKRFLVEVSQTVPSTTWWDHKEVGHNDEAKKESKSLFGESLFGTPKPERLIQKILTLASNPNDLILDSFLGSGTTIAVAHKMNRRWIGIELGDHAYTHCQPRMKKVVDGLDEGGITKSVGWEGGGGFKFYELAPSLLQKDPFGNWVIDPAYNADMLAAAMAKHEGYKYRPDEQLFWKQGQSTEKDYIFTTTQFVAAELIDKIHEQMQEGESLLICCKSYQDGCDSRYPAINIRKIPVMLLGRCEFGKDDYRLHIIDMPREEGEAPFEPAARKTAREERQKPGAQQELFDL